jgi:cell division protein FtsB
VAAKKKRRRRIGGPIARRWFAMGALVLVGLLYYRPLHDYVDAHAQQAVQQAAVRKLERQQVALKKRLRQATSDAALAAEARTLGYVRPGEHLFIVKDIPQWLRRQHASRHAARRGHRR